MVIKIGVNGFGRIGRIVFRTCFTNSNIEISAINDPTIDIDYICYLMKFDSTHGKFNQDISYSEKEITINDKKIHIFHEKVPSSIPWQTLGVQYVIEASGMFTTIEKASGHLISTSVKRVVVTAPSVDIPMLIVGVNEEQIPKDQKVISCASSTLYCLAPIIKLLENNYGISEGFVTSIHAMTPSLKPLDGLCLRGRHWRDHRSIHQNIIPVATGACKALGKIIPQVKDKICGLAFRVPIVNVSVLDITIRLIKSTTLQKIAALIEEARTTNMKNIISISYDETVSSDFMNNENSCVLDVLSSLELTSRSFKLICWYENEYSYACRVIDTVMFSEEQLKSHKSPSALFIPIKPRSNFCQFKSTSNDHSTLDKINVENNLKIFNSMSLGSGLKQQLNKKTAKEPLYCVHFEKHLNIFKTNNFNNDHAVTSLVCDNQNDTLYSDTLYEELDIESNNNNVINLKEETEHLAQKESAKIANQTDNLLKQPNHRTLQKVKPNETVTEESESNENDTTNNIVTNNKNNVIFRTRSLDMSHTLRSSQAKNNRKQVRKANQDAISEKDSKLVIIDKHILEAVVDISDHDELRKNNASYKNVNIDKATNQVNVQEKIVFDVEPMSDTSLNDIEEKFVATSNAENNIKRLFKDNQSENNCNILSNNNVGVNLVAGNGYNNAILNSNEADDSNIIEKNTNKAIKKRTMSTLIKKSVIDSKLSMFEEAINRLAKKDLFDKLDSDSESDNSLQVYETKSQVIDITDLSNSTDDLARLDKICRIIEISDDLSDQLFSSLDNMTHGELSKKEWSFKDLCEKIKLDDFCNKVFGKSI